MGPTNNGDTASLDDSSPSVALERPVAAFLFCLIGLVVFLGSLSILIISSDSLFRTIVPTTASGFPGWSIFVGLAIFGLLFITFPIYLAFWFIFGIYREPHLHRQIGFLLSIVSTIWLTVFVPVLLQTMIVHAEGLVRDTGFNDPTIQYSFFGMLVGPILVLIGGLSAIAWKPMIPIAVPSITDHRD